jgi:uncharacterized protein (DUF427 family)
MGLSWQQGPLGRDPGGAFVTASPMPERVLYVEALRRRMSVKLGGSVIAQSDDAALLFEPGRYPVAYFALADIAAEALQPTDRETTHRDLGETQWFDVVGGDGQISHRAAWQHVDPPQQATALRDTVAFAWRAMDGFYEEDERILGHGRITDLVSFEPEKVAITIDGEKLEQVPGQNVVAHGADRNLSVDEVGGVELVESEISAEAGA